MKRESSLNSAGGLTCGGEFAGIKWKRRRRLVVGGGGSQPPQRPTVGGGLSTLRAGPTDRGSPAVTSSDQRRRTDPVVVEFPLVRRARGRPYPVCGRPDPGPCPGRRVSPVAYHAGHDGAGRPPPAGRPGRIWGQCRQRLSDSRSTGSGSGAPKGTYPAPDFQGFFC